MVTKKRFFNQLAAWVLCVCMIFGLSAGFPVSALASSAGPENPGKQMTDISGHWAESQVGNWVKKGLISGFPDETFRPNNPITRAEFMALVNRAYGFSEKAAISFSDVSESDWFYDDVAKAVAAGYIVGYGDGTAGAGNNISRQEAAAVIYRLMKLPEYSSKDAIEKFSDYGSISAWSRGAVNSVVAEGYMVGNPNGTFGPANNITRAETVVTLSRAIGEIYNAAGTYSEVRTIKGNATINTAGITLDGAVVEGNLYLTPGIGEGTVVLRNVTVKGTTIIAGGGKNSVILEDCELNKVVIEREDGIVRVSAQGGTSIQVIVVAAGTILDSVLLNEEGGILTVYVTADEAVELSGSFGTVHVENPGAVINVTGGSVENLIIAETAAGSSVNISENASVTNMDINAPVTVTGQGTVGNAVIGEGAEETTFEKEPVNMEGPGSTAPSTPPGGSTGGGGTGGGTTLTTVNIAAISGVTAPVTGQTPVSAIAETAQYNGTVAWSPADGSFAASTEYTATITLTAKSGYSLNGVAANFFTVAGATSVSNAANSGVITVVFPATAAPEQPTTYTLTLTGDNISAVPVAGAIAVNTSVTITVSPAMSKQVAAFTVGGIDRKAELAAPPANQYTFTITADTIVAVTYEDIPVGGDEAPPALTADVTGNFPKTNLDITFTDDIDWRNAVTAVKVNSNCLTQDTQYELSEGKLRLKTNAIPVMQAADTYTVIVEATDYQTATVSQTVVTGLSGSGTAGDPFTVANAGDLDKVRYYVGVAALYFNQTADIDLNTIDWQPIGIYDQTMVTDGEPFMANYNGKDYYIENLRIADNSQTYKSGSGLFSHTKEAGLSNIRLKGVDIDVPNTGSVGALVGEAIETSITDCVVENSTKVKGNNSVGGLIGYAHQSTISCSSADILVMGESSSSTITHKVGGFIGNSGGNTITGSSAHGNVSGIKEVGGFAGYMNYGTITGCFADGNVTSYENTAQDTGGFVGLNYHATADQCYAISTVSGRNYVGGFAGRNIGTITNSYARGSVAYTGTVAGGFVGRIQNNAANLLGGSPSDTGYNYSDVAISGSGATIGAFRGEHDTSAPGGSGIIHHNHYNSGIAVVNQGSDANGLTLENMKKQTSFPEWDFTNVWAIQEDVRTPYHRWETLSDNANLSTLSVVGQSLIPSFAAGTLSYSVEVDYDVDAVNIMAAPADTNASMTVNGIHLGMGNPQSVALGAAGTDTVITVQVTAENGITSKVYTIVISRENEPLSEKSVYDILFAPSGLEAGVGKDVEITLKAVEVKDEGYDLVRINVSVTDKPSNSTVALTGNYGAGPVDVIALGYWGPETGHPVSADYDMSYNLIALFSEPGQYTLAISLRDMNEGTDILTKNVTITVAEAAIPTYTLALTGDNISSDPVAGAIEENTEVTITVSPAAGKQVAAFTVGGTDKKVELLAAPTHQYVFSITEDITVAVTYEDIPSGITPPALNADSTQNYAGQNLMITFSDGVTWANAITEISVEGEILSVSIPGPEQQYAIVAGMDEGQITLFGNNITALQSRGSKEVRVKSAGYADAVVTQEITASYFDHAEFSTQPAGPTDNGGLLVTQPVVSLYDQYGNPCIDGPDSAREITLQKATGDTWTLGGAATVNAVNGVATFTGLTATNPSGLAITDARLMYEVVGSPSQYFYSGEFTIPGATGLVAPTLTADDSDNYAGANITITLQSGDWADWLGAITAVKVESDTLTTSEPKQYNIGEGILSLLTADITQLQTPGTYTITVEASGYNNAVVSQNITAGPQASAVFTTQPLGPTVSGGQLQQQPVVTLYDTYGNICADGPSHNASITLQKAVGDSWSLGGTISVDAVNGVATFTDLTASNSSGADITDARMGYTYQGSTTYSDYFTVPGLGSQAAPALTADTTANYAGNTIEITFTDDPAWRAAVDSIIVVKDVNHQIFNSSGVSLAEGKLILDTAQIPQLQERTISGLMISIAAPNYQTTWVYQPITSGIAASMTIETQPQGPAANGGVFQSAPVISLSDAYGNPCIDGPSSGAAVTAAKLDAGDWTLGGTTTSTASQGTVTFGNLSAVNNTAADIATAKLSFTVDGTAVTADSDVFTIPFGFTLTLEADPEGGGTAEIGSGGSSGLYLAGTQIAVTAEAGQDYEFVNWTVDGAEVSTQQSFTYTMPASDTTLVANFQPAGTLTPPTLTPDTTDNCAGEVIWLEFPYNFDYADAIYALEIGGIEYTNTEETTVFDYSFSDGQYILRLFPANISPLQTRGTYEITVKATGYLNAVVTQVITAARIHTDECLTITGPESGQTYSSGQPLPEIKLQLKDIYGNALIDGPDAGITLTAEIPQGYGGACTLSGTLEAVADANGQITFNDIVVNLNGGVNEDSLTLKFTGTYSLGYEITIYLTGSGLYDWIVFTVAEQP